MGKEIKIGLLWHSFRSGNLGVGALSVCNIDLVDKELKKSGLTATYTIIGNSGPFDYVPNEYSGRVDFVHFSAKNFIREPLYIYRKIAECDVVFDIGEGDSFSDIYGLSRFVKMSFSKMVTILNGNRLVFSPQTIGPFNTWIGKTVAGYLMRHSHAVVARDYMSRKVLGDFHLENAYEAIDVAFLLPYVEKAASQEREKIKFGLNVSGLLYHGGYSGNNQFGLSCDYKSFTLRLLRELCGDERVEVHLVPHVLTLDYPVEDDYQVCEILKKEFPRVKLPPRFNSPSEAKSYISQLDVFAGARMHATVGAFSSNVPVLPLAYSRKFAGLFESIKYGRVLDMRTLDEDQLVSGVLEGIDDRAQMKKEIEIGRSEAEERLNVYRKVIRSALVGLRKGV